MSDPAPLIAAEGLTRDYDGLRAVDGIDLRLERGQVLGLLGPNGAGKTSTMEMLCGALAPTAGAIAIDGIDLLEQPRRAKAALGYLPERPPLYPELSVAEFLRFAAALRGVERRHRPASAERAMERCGLADAGGRLIDDLSLGYRQRVGIAQAIVHEPAAIVLDEPTIGLDPIQIREIRSLIAALGREHGVILSTHILAEVQAICSDVAIMHRGRIAFAESTDRLGDTPVEAVIMAFTRPPARPELESIDGVRAVTDLGDDRYRVAFDPGRTHPSTLAAHAVERGWGLAELRPERHDLEQIFLAVTAHDDAAPATAPEVAA